jgi:hypothetical protein
MVCQKGNRSTLKIVSSGTEKQNPFQVTPLETQEDRFNEPWSIQI